MDKEIDVQNVIDIPRHTIKKNIDNFTIILAPEQANWIVLDNIEFQLYIQLEKNMTVLSSMEFVLENEILDDEELVIEKMTSLLTKIDEADFYNNVDCAHQSDIEKIKKSIHINMTNNCNMRCTHCYMSAGLSDEIKLNFNDIVEKIKEINNEIGYTNIVISGGEPLVYPNIIEFLKKISNNYITLFTNGTLINEDNYEEICNLCNEIQISFEGLNEEMYESVRGKNNFSKVINAIQLIKKKNVKLLIAITILPNNVLHLQKNLVNFVKNLNYDNLVIKLNSEIEKSGNALNLDLKNYNKYKTDLIIMDLMKKLNEIGISIDFRTGRRKKLYNCGIGSNIFINFDGSIYPCIKFVDMNWDIKTPINEIISDFNDMNKRTSVLNIKECNSCELKYICAGGCRVNNYLNKGSMIEPVCDQEYKDNQYKNMIVEYLRGIIE